MGEGRRRGIERICLGSELFSLESLVGALVVVIEVDGDVRVGLPAIEAWYVEVGAWRWIPGPGT